MIAKSWSELTTTELYDIARLRTDVFLVEQKVDESELDGRDKEEGTLHVWIADEQGVAAYLRVLLDADAEYRDAHRVIGRVVVRPDRRGQRLSRLLLDVVVDRFGTDAMMLHAQSYVVPVYEKVGFVSFGEEYVEAGILHRSMYREPHGASVAGA